jgi:hypothetical protein
MAVDRVQQIRRRQKRREKLARLRERYRRAQSAEERAAILDRVRLIAPSVKIETFLASVRRAGEDRAA